MKIGKVEGSPEEIKDLFEDKGLNLHDFLEIPKPPLRQKWICIPSVISTICILILAVIPFELASLRTGLFYISFIMDIWVAGAIQIRFTQIGFTVFVLASTWAVTMLSYGSITPSELMAFFKQLKG